MRAGGSDRPAAGGVALWMRSPLIVTSAGVHIAVVIAFVIAGLWKLERLDGEKRRFDIAVAPSPAPAASGSPAAAPMTFTKKKPKIVIRDVVQPTKVDSDATPAATSTLDTGGTGGTGSGAGSGSGTSPIGDGECVGEGCGAPEPKQPAAKPTTVEPVIVSPAVIKGMRTSGETQIHPPAPVKTAIRRDGVDKVTATWRLCVAANGQIASTTLLRSSGYAGYDSALDDGLRRWHYRPYEIGGRQLPVCGVVTFIYTLQ